MATPLSEAERDRIVELCEQRWSRNRIAAEVGRSVGVVSKVVKAAGASFDRGPVIAATQAALADNRAKRAALETRFLDEAALLLDELHQPHLVYNFGGKDNSYEERVHDSPDISGKRSLIQAAKTATDAAMRLGEVDVAHSDAEQGKSLVDRMWSALEEAREQIGGPADIDQAAA